LEVVTWNVSINSIILELINYIKQQQFPFRCVLIVRLNSIKANFSKRFHMSQLPLLLKRKGMKRKYEQKGKEKGKGREKSKLHIFDEV